MTNFYPELSEFTESHDSDNPFYVCMHCDMPGSTIGGLCAICHKAEIEAEDIRLKLEESLEDQRAGLTEEIETKLESSQKLPTGWLRAASPNR